MALDQRTNTRFDDFGKVNAPDICVFPGILADISLTGCKIRFPAHIELDMECDYELKITPTRKNLGQPFMLIAHPQWISGENDSTEIGFKVLRSPGSKQLAQYVKSRADTEQDSDDNYMSSFISNKRNSHSCFYSASAMSSI